MDDGDYDLDASRYCSDGLKVFQSSLLPHAFSATLALSVGGLIGNVVNMVVFSQRRMRNAINAILLGLAVVHLLFLIEVVVNVCVMNLPLFLPAREALSYWLVQYYVFHINFGMVCDVVETWLILTFAVWCIVNPLESRRWRRMGRAVATIVAAFVVCPILCVPLYITFAIVHGYILVNDEGNTYQHFGGVDGLDVSNATLIFHWKFSELAEANESALIHFNELLYGVIFKFGPCIALAVLAIYNFCNRNERRDSSTPTDDDTDGKALTKGWRQTTYPSGTISSDDDDGDSTLSTTPRRPTSPHTAVLKVMVVFFFVPVKLFHGTLNLLGIVLGTEFTINCQLPLTEVITMTTLVLPLATCFLYCKTNEPFWSTLKQLLTPRCVARWYLRKLRQRAANNNNVEAESYVTQLPQS